MWGRVSFLLELCVIAMSGRAAVQEVRVLKLSRSSFLFCMVDRVKRNPTLWCIEWVCWTWVESVGRRRLLICGMVW